MKMFKYAAAAIGLLVASLAITATPAQAQATRTWVSGVGDDVNPCSRTAPCKTFAGAISKTAAGGEINCIDQGAYGAVTITKSIAIICEGVTAGVLHSATNGIVINAPVDADVFLKGLDINGSPPTAGGLNGIRFLAGRSLTVENCVIRGSTGAAPNGFGIAFQPSGSSKLAVSNTVISNNANGILIQPTGANGKARVFLDDVAVVNNLTHGVSIDTTGNTAPAGVIVAIHDSEISGNTNGINTVAPAGTTTAVAMITSTHVFNNSGQGIFGNGANVKMRVANTVITANGVGVNPGGLSSINNLGGNILAGNTNDNTFN